ncbi:MAG: CDP-alcohol phosphatidyltransferase family protein [Candidatus Ornithomonoglobus sp.]
MKRLPNLITLSRIAASLALIPMQAFSWAFLTVYIYCGVSDVLDGALARRTHSESEMGARLDSAADIIFYAVVILKLFPMMYHILPRGIWHIVGIIVIIRLLSFTVAAVKYRCFASLHTYLNKLTGFFVFTIPYIIFLPFAEAACFVISIIAALSAAEELLIHVCSDTYNPKTKTLFERKTENT